MSDDLVKRARHNALSDMPHYASVELIEALANCIEEIEAKLIETAKGLAVEIRRADAAEAKLAKAVTFLQDQTGAEWPYDEDAKRILAELSSVSCANTTGVGDE